MHMVLLPHMPSWVTSRSPVGTGIVTDVDVVGGLTEVELGVVVGGTGVELVVGRAVVVGTTLGHPHVPYCAWQSKSGWQWSTESPQKP
jgi:hypothetical protein